MSKHHPDLIMCRRQPGIAIGRLCEKCDGKCPVCDSYVRPETLVRIATSAILELMVDAVSSVDLQVRISSRSPYSVVIQ
ncbi:PHF5-like protein-domain-containing protein [Russula vinacea]|nr:PHF5-like protein-domain-containing protein [Russula vinacea]